MYKIRLRKVEKAHQYEELIKVFIKPEDFIIILDGEDNNASNTVSEEEFKRKSENQEYSFDFLFDGDKDKLKREIFNSLSDEFGTVPAWGTVTGIRPVKLFGEIAEGKYDNADIDKDSIKTAENTMKKVYCVSGNKVKLVSDIYRYQQATAGKAKPKSIGMYIGIPFCPTRCMYCSFTSNQASAEIIEKYLQCLLKEMDFVGKELKKRYMTVESVYIGGGTPTTLDANQLERLLESVRANTDAAAVKEITLEAGRPDTVDDVKMKVAKTYGVKRVSINPQSMNDRTLKLIGRAHSAAQIKEAVDVVRNAGIKEINMDIITGLPGEKINDFRYTLDKVIDLSPENVTVHTLAVKRTSRLAEADKNYHYKYAKIAEEMMKHAYKRLEKEEYVPYYLYRQKHMTGAGENVGFCKKGTENLYNIRIMDEHQSILALGAGGVSKVYFPCENRLERTANVSNYEVYIDRIDEMIERKKENFFKEVAEC